ncbi:MAG: Appr-1-p processing domain protein [Candidatus Curtissbacteria bacterium GW2011_GWA1_40_16]|uniref:Appr-1-p processing domain protein n=1 Tax=Candidatus Curtissbacteria bacterium GW2011_GWA1_40_16 TaxID=1618405 RepID=A0A0G0RAB1_9BACT|nr:MAG: Appr-1-p processing domain protein [Candidatus Curtissbacteria bacterium GW2011_GWA1_40_16]
MRVDKDPPCDEDVVRQCVASVLAVAEAEDAESIAFPAMGTGVWGMSMADSISGTVKGIRDYFREINPESKIKKVSLVIYAEPTLANANELKSIMTNEVGPRLKSGQD